MECDRQSAPLALADSLVSPRVRRVLLPLLLIAGIECWLILGRGDYGRTITLQFLLAVILIGSIPVVFRHLSDWIGSLANPSPRASRLIALSIAILSTGYLVLTAKLQQRDFAPRWQDEMSYAVQIQMLSEGKLWMHAHPLADFFDSFQIIVKPVYASMYFPGASLFYVPFHWVGLPHWLMSALMSGACASLLYRIVTELISGAAGLLSVLLLLGLHRFREYSIMVMGYPAITLLTLAMVFCWLGWRNSKSLKWVLMLGIVSGWAAITRPLDAVIFAIPIGLDLVLQMVKSKSPKRLYIAAVLMAGALPFLGLQLYFNVGVTGSWRETPFEFYAKCDYPGTKLGFPEYDPAHRPVSSLPQKQRFHDIWTVPAIQQHRPGNILANWFNGNLQDAISGSLPHALLLVLLPAGLIGLIDGRRTAFVSVVVLWLVLYSLYTWYLPQYAMILAAPIILLALLGYKQLQNAWPGTRRWASSVLTLVLVMLSLSGMREFNRTVRDATMVGGELANIELALSHLDHKPAIVLFRFPPEGNPHQEPVYNYETAWPDDAQVIRAHDLGLRNIELFNYYGQRQPDRAIYIYDRAAATIQYLGLAKELTTQPF